MIAAKVVEVSWRPKRGYWYKNYIWECPICGAGDHVRERQYTPPPTKHSHERWDYSQRWDGCNDL